MHKNLKPIKGQQCKTCTSCSENVKMPKLKTIVLCGGGTAGHVMPNVALASELKKSFDVIHYIGGKGIEKQIIGEIKDIVFHEISAEKFRRNFSLKNLLIPFKVIKGYFQSKKILKTVHPSVIFSKGGFISVPCVLAAKKLKIPVLSHESDLTLGLANKIIYRFSKKMFCSFKETISYGNKCVYSGSIIRPQVFLGNAERAKKTYSIDPNKKTIFIMGGSLGSLKINNLMFKLAPALVEKYNIIHICGKLKTNQNLKLKNYNQIDFTNRIEDCFKVADFIISRAGSNSIFEFLALKKPMLLIPISKSASRGDQILNAQNFKKNGLALVLEEENLNEKTLLNAIHKLTIFVPKIAGSCTSGNEMVLKEIIKISTKNFN